MPHPGHGNTTRAQSGEGTTVDPPARAYIHLLRGLGLQMAEIGDVIGCHSHTVSTILQDSREAVHDGADPIDEFERRMAPLLDLDPDAGGDE